MDASTTRKMFVVSVPAADVEAASDVLWQLGVRGIEERADRMSAGVELWTSVGDDPAALDRAAAALGERWPWRVLDVVDERVEAWREHAGTTWVDPTMVVVPAWLEHSADPGVTAVVVEPGAAFGLGDHPTTLLSLRALRRHLRPGSTVLDVGCGSGVLGVAAVLGGAASVRSIDVASAAVEATRDNAERNHVASLVEVDTARAADLDGPFDLVVANILAPTLIELAGQLRRLTAPAGRLIVSGVLADRHDHVLTALTPMVVEHTDDLDGWSAVVLRHR